MALALNNYVTIPVQATTSPVGIYTAPAGYNAVVLCSQATNLDSIARDVTLSLERDIAGVASSSSGTKLTTKGATGWGVRSINAFISKYYE